MCAVVLLLAGLLVYSNSFDGVFVADDEDAIVRNETIRSVATAFAPPRDTTVAGRPFLNLTFAWNFFAGGLDPWGYHAVNLAIHLGAALALFGVIGRTATALQLPARYGISGTTLACATALLWVVHPLTTAAVTYVVQRAESLVALLLLLTLYAALRADPPSHSAPRWPSEQSRYWTVVAIVACGLGMATKEVMVVAPLVVAAWLWIVRPDVPLLAGHRKMLLAGLAATWGVLAGLVAVAPRGQSVGFTLGGWTPLSYLLTQAEVIVHYVRLVLVPTPLVFMYSWAPASWFDALPEVTGLLAALIATVILFMRRHPLALPGVLFFLVLAPSSSLLPIATEVAAEHRMYLPLGAVLAVAVVAWLRLLSWLSPSHSRLHWVVVAVIATASGVMTHARNRDYESIEALMRDTVENSPANLRARVIYGGHLLALERYAEAEAQLRVAVTLPERVAAEQGLAANAHSYLGSTLAAQGRFGDAIPHLERAIQLSPDLGEAHAFLANVYASQGKLTAAAASFDRALELMPPVPALLERAAAVFNALAAERAREGRNAEARAAAEKAQALVRRAAAARGQD